MDKQSLHETAKRLALELPFVELCWPFGPEFDVFKIGGKIFMLSSELRGVPFINLKSDPQKSLLNQQIYPSIKPGYHMNKKHWISVYPGEEISEALLRDLINDSWNLVVVDQEDADGRFATPEAKAANDKGRKFFADMHRKDLHDDAEWMAKQVYLNVGNFLLGVAALGLDAVPIEGFDAAILDEEFGLKEKGYTSLVVVPVGHHSVEDFNATLPKSRLPQNITLTEV